jgi:hypothetical protein
MQRILNLPVGAGRFQQRVWGQLPRQGEDAYVGRRSLARLRLLRRRQAGTRIRTTATSIWERGKRCYGCTATLRVSSRAGRISRAPEHSTPDQAHTPCWSWDGTAFSALALSKMNWNNDALYDPLPVTMGYAQILTRVIKRMTGLGTTPYQFRFFM